MTKIEKVEVVNDILDLMDFIKRSDKVSDNFKERNYPDNVRVEISCNRFTEGDKNFSHIVDKFFISIFKNDTLVESIIIDPQAYNEAYIEGEIEYLVNLVQ